jgi:hypothetical protein
MLLEYFGEALDRCGGCDVCGFIPLLPGLAPGVRTPLDA